MRLTTKTNRRCLSGALLALSAVGCSTGGGGGGADAAPPVGVEVGDITVVGFERADAPFPSATAADPALLVYGQSATGERRLVVRSSHSAPIASVHLLFHLGAEEGNLKAAGEHVSRNLPPQAAGSIPDGCTVHIPIVTQAECTQVSAGGSCIVHTDGVASCSAGPPIDLCLERPKTWDELQLADLDVECPVEPEPEPEPTGDALYNACILACRSEDICCIQDPNTYCDWQDDFGNNLEAHCIDQCSDFVAAVDGVPAGTACRIALTDDMLCESSLSCSQHDDNWMWSSNDEGEQWQRLPYCHVEFCQTIRACASDLGIVPGSEGDEYQNRFCGG